MGMTKEAEDYIKKADSLSFIAKIQRASQPSEINFIDNSVPDDTSNQVTQIEQ